MCNYVYLILPEPCVAAALLPSAALAHRVLRPLSQHPVCAKLAPHEHLYRTRSGACDCGTPLASIHKPAAAARNHASEVEKLRKKGWPAAKIVRWQQEKARAEQREDDKQAAEAAARRAEVQSWVALLNACAACYKPRSIGLLVTWEGRPGDMRFLKRNAPMPIRAVTPDFLLGMAENTIYEFRA